MKILFGETVIFLLWLLMFGTPAPGVEPNSAEQSVVVVKAALIPCKDMIDRGLYESIKRRTGEALATGAEYLIYEVDTYGGDLFAAFDISSYLLDEAGSKAHTVAYVSRKAISAGAMISVACEDIIMKEKSTIGDCAPIQLQGELTGVKREKVETVTREAFANAAEANGYPEVLLKAMVSMHKTVYRVRNLGTGDYEFFDGERLPKDPNKYDVEDKELIVSDKELLTLTATKAVEYGVARAQVKGLEGVLDFLAERDGVTFTGKPIVFKPNWSEQMVRWLNSPAVMGVLVMLALLGVYIELHTPGVGLPGLVAVICFAIIIGSKYLVGMANWVEVALFVVGVLLLMVEIFVLPGFGIAGILGTVCILMGLFGMLIKNPPDKLPWPENQLDWQLFSNGVLGLFFGFTGFVILAWLLTKFLPKLEFLSGLILQPAMAKRGDEMEVNLTAPPESDAVAVKVGDTGEVVSTLRPTGKARFGGAIVDVVAEAEFLDKDTKVEIIEIHGNRVVVRGVGN